MRMNKSLLLSLFALLLLAACSKDEETAPAVVTASNNAALKQSNSSKFITGSIAYQFNPVFSLPCSCGGAIDVGTFSGSGNISHLGLATSSIKPCLIPIAGGFHVAEECATLVAANGDEIFCHTLPYDIYFTPSGLAVGNLEVVFNGGTGRFAGATGGFTGTVTINNATGSAILSNLNGTIN